MDGLRKLKRDKWAPNDSYALCSCHFAPEDFTLQLSFGNLKCQQTLIKDNIGVLPVPKFQCNSWGEEDLSDRSRRTTMVVLQTFCENRACQFFFHFWSTLVQFLFSLQSCRFWAPSTEDSESSVIADQVEKNIDPEPMEQVDLKILADPFLSPPMHMLSCMIMSNQFCSCSFLSSIFVLSRLYSRNQSSPASGSWH